MFPRIYKTQLSDHQRAKRALNLIMLADRADRAAFAHELYGFDAERTLKAVSGWTDPDVAATSGDDVEIMERLTESTVFTRLADRFMRTEPETPALDPYSAATAAYVVAGQPIPVQAGALTKHSLPAGKLAAMTVFSKESLRQRFAEESVYLAIQGALTEAADRQFLGIDQTAFTDAPVPITQGVEQITATSSAKESIRNLCSGFPNLDQAVLIMAPESALDLSLQSGSDGHTAELGCNGGYYGGIPVLTSGALDWDSNGAQAVLLNPSRVLAYWSAVEVSRSEEATIDMRGEIDSTGDGVGEKVSLFQTDAVAGRIIWHHNFKLLETEHCRVLTDIDWS